MSAIDNLITIDISKIKDIGFVNRPELLNKLNDLSRIKRMLDELIGIFNINGNIPNPLMYEVEIYATAIIEYLDRIQAPINGESSEVVASKKDAVLRDIGTFCNECENLNTLKGVKFYTLYNTIKNFGIDKEKEADNVLSKITKDFDKELAEVESLKSDMNSNTSEIKTILNELKKKAAEQTISDYAIVFQNEAAIKNTIAKNWLVTGVVMIILFIGTILIFNLNDWLPSEIFNNANQLLHYNISNVITKLIIYAIMIFVISFSFKQYNICKHLNTINTHRQNALNSYKLFTQSIVGEDFASQNALMIQVAKSIYEQNQTGYLGNENNQGVNSGIIELTKIIGSNRPV